MPKDPNDFRKTTRDTLAKRAGQRCSRPGCTQPTVGPHKDDAKNVDVGEAAHIRGAKPGSKRYRPSMTPAERRSISNGIWLCRTCAKLIDSDGQKYTESLLFLWKRTHEAQIEREVEGFSLHESLLSTDLAVFKNEPPAAQQIALDQPRFWEYLLVIELLRPKMEAILQDWRDLESGLVFGRAKTLTLSEFFKWFQEDTEDLSRAIAALNHCIHHAIVEAWGKPGQPGNPIKILRACNHLTAVCNFFLEHEKTVRALLFPKELEHLHSDFLGWTQDIVQQVYGIVDVLASVIADADQAEGKDVSESTQRTYEMVITLPNKVDTLNDRIFSALKSHGY